MVNFDDFFKILSIIIFSFGLIFRLFYFFVNANNNKTTFLQLRQLSVLFDLSLASFFFVVSLKQDMFYFKDIIKAVLFNTVEDNKYIEVQNYFVFTIIFSLVSTFTVAIRFLMELSQLHSVNNPISNGVSLKRLIYLVGGFIFIYTVIFSFLDFFDTKGSIDIKFPFSQKKPLILLNLCLFIMTFGIFSLSFAKLYINVKREIPDYSIQKKINIYLLRYLTSLLIYIATNIPVYFIGLAIDYHVTSQTINVLILLLESYPFLNFLIDYIIIKIYLHKDKNFVNKAGLNSEDMEKIRLWKHAEYFIYFNSFSEEFSSLINHEFLCCFLYGISTAYSTNDRKNRTSGNIDQDFENKSEIYDVYYTINDNTSKKRLNIDDKKQTFIIPNESNIKGTIIEFYPKIFDSLRSLENVEYNDICSSFDPEANASSLKNIKESDGKSGSFFFFTHDKKFIIKTIKDSEKKTATNESFLSSFVNHMKENFDSSIITKIYGIYKIILSNKSSINIILMQNLMLIPVNKILRVFDLKGSKVDRKTKHLHNTSKTKALKDLDFLWMKKTNGIADFSEDAIEKIETTMESDLSLLRDLNLMDYSFLLIVVAFPKPDDPDYPIIINLFGDPKYCCKIIKSRTSKYIYCYGIIDYLQEFNTKKFLENKYKSVLYGKNIKYVSAVDPTNYSERMKTFFKENVLVSNTTN